MKPMLAATLPRLEDAELPVVVSPKLDGIRCLIHNGVAVSRNLKPIPNKYIQERLRGLPDGLDGELVIGLPNKTNFNVTQSYVMSEEGECDKFVYYIFDVNLARNYQVRLDIIKRIVAEYYDRPVALVETTLIETLEYLHKIETDYTQMGYEGIMLRAPDSPYKHGRSTLKEGYLLKYKRFIDDEATVIGFEERLHNNNEAEKDALGYSKRSTKKEGLIPTETLGALLVSWNGHTFSIGTGFTQEQRETIWQHRDRYLDRRVTFKYQEPPQYGLPRFPVFKCFREE